MNNREISRVVRPDTGPLVGTLCVWQCGTDHDPHWHWGLREAGTDRLFIYPCSYLSQSEAQQGMRDWCAEFNPRKVVKH